MRFCVRALSVYPAAAPDWRGAYVGGFGGNGHATRDISVPSITEKRLAFHRLGWSAGRLSMTYRGLIIGCRRTPQVLGWPRLARARDSLQLRGDDHVHASSRLRH